MIDGEICLNLIKGCAKRINKMCDVIEENPEFNVPFCSLLLIYDRGYFQKNRDVDFSLLDYGELKRKLKMKIIDFEGFKKDKEKDKKEEGDDDNNVKNVGCLSESQKNLIDGLRSLESFLQNYCNENLLI